MAAAALASAPRHPPLHGLATRVVHWASAALLVMAVGAALVNDVAEWPGSARTLAAAHMSAGLGVLLLTCLRALIRAVEPLPVHAGLPRLLERAARAMRWALYGLLFVVPMLGVLRSNAAGRTVGFPGLPPLPLLIGRDREMASLLGDLHELCAWTLLCAVVVHALAAVWHGVVRRDQILASILGRWAFTAGARRDRAVSTEGKNV